MIASTKAVGAPKAKFIYNVIEELDYWIHGSGYQSKEFNPCLIFYGVSEPMEMQFSFLVKQK